MTIADNLFKQSTYITRFRIVNFFSYLSPCVSSALACKFVYSKLVFFNISNLWVTSYFK